MRDPAELISAYFDDELADGEFAQLREWIHADRANLQRFVRESLIHSRIRDLLHEREVCSLFAEEGDEQAWIDPHHIVSLLEEEAEAAERRAREAEELAEREALAASRRRELELDRASLRIEPQPIPRRWYVAAAVAASLLLMLAWQMTEPSLVREAPRAAVEPVVPTVVGEISSSIAAIRAGEQESLPRAKVVAGPFSLQSGVVEIALNCGARLVVEGPASLELVSSDRVHLHRGRVVANVPPEAVGFTLRSKAASFVDLGTEFGVEVTETGAASIHVLDGEVALVQGDRASEKPSRMLQMGAASSVSADGATVEDIPFEASRFFRRVPATAYELAVRQSRPLLYWRMANDASTATTISEGRLRAEGRLAPGVQPGAVGYEGDNRALHFSRVHQGVDLGAVAELGLVVNFTCEAWARSTARPHSDEGIGPQRILSTFDRMPRTGYAFGLVDGKWYDMDQPGLSVHFTAHGVYDCVSMTSVPVEEWVYLAAVIDGEGKPSLYINGQQSSVLCRPSSGSEAERWIQVERLTQLIGRPSPGPALIGRNPIGNDGESPPERFEGLLSDLAVYDRALSSAEIAQHFQAPRRAAVAE